ncbi:autotransporter outer membrane beta-barrel domain-containing protein [Stenotrophomonas sp. NPDC077464]|uniref:autotransporter family protein n=1 Tax=unclassified Stenotrophomonas TaxID=196198 RepID=UPI0037CF06D4
MLALLTLPTRDLGARELDAESALVGADDAAEDWTLRNGARLVVHLGRSRGIEAFSGSEVTLSGAEVTRNAYSDSTVRLHGGASLNASGSRFVGGGVWLEGASTAILRDSRILMTHLGADFRGASIGVSLLGYPGSAPGLMHAVLDATRVEVRDVEGNADNSSGLGVRMDHGRVDILNGSHIEAANVGVLLMPLMGEGSGHLRVDNATLRSGRGAAIHVDSRYRAESDRHYSIEIANGAQLFAGDGNLLLAQGRADNGKRTIDFAVDDAQLAGNLRVDNANADIDVAVTLRNNARLQGRFFNVASAAIGTGSQWQLTGDSNVGHLRLDAGGSVALGNGAGFHTLTVDRFVGDGGSLLFNAALGDDHSATDRLVIQGDAEGRAGVRVLNAGGAGAQTAHGIELIDIQGASHAHFDLIGRAIGGQYEYFLVKGGDGSWYLRSEQVPPTNPCSVDPSLPGCTPTDPVDPDEPVDPEQPADPDPPLDPEAPVDPGEPGDPVPAPLLRPEAGAYLANQFAVHHLLRHSGRERPAPGSSATGPRVWASVDTAQARLRPVSDQLALTQDRSRLQLGTDIGTFAAGRGRIGAMLTAVRSEARSRSSITGYSARGTVTGGAAGVHASWDNDALYLDASLQHGRFGNRVEGDGLALERYRARAWQSSLEAGYRMQLGTLAGMAVALQPELQLFHTDAAIDDHREANGTQVRSLGDDAFSTRIALRLQGTLALGDGTRLQPYLAGTAYREGDLDGVTFDGDALDANAPRTRHGLDAGLRVDGRTGVSATAGVGHLRGDGGYRESTAHLRLRYRW